MSKPLVEFDEHGIFYVLAPLALENAGFGGGLKVNTICDFSVGPTLPIIGNIKNYDFLALNTHCDGPDRNCAGQVNYECTSNGEGELNGICGANVAC